MRIVLAGRRIVIATMHGKEAVLKPVLEQALGVETIVPRDLNTDAFGMFSGEVERGGSPLDAARQKCEAAAALTGERLALSSEGSFGAHPVLGFVPANEELLLLKDVEQGWEIKAKVTSTHTNFSGSACRSWEEVLAFASKIGFPSHGLMVRATQECKSDIKKGICDWEELRKTTEYFRRGSGSVYLETDMRAHYNPTRMKVIGEAAEKLLAVIGSTCPNCEGPGFAVSDVISGLPCSECAMPTRTAKAHIYSCQHCGYVQRKEYPSAKQKEDPVFCDVCNP